MTRLTAEDDFALTSAKQIEADLAAGRRDAGLPPLTVEECEIAKDAAFAAFDADPSPRNRKEAEICRRALSRADDAHERATRTGLYAPVDMGL